MTYQIVSFLMTLSGLQGNSPIASLFKYDFDYSCAAVDKISNDSTMRGPSTTAELLVLELLHHVLYLYRNTWKIGKHLLSFPFIAIITSSKVEKFSVKDSKRSSEVSPGTEKPRTAKRLLNRKSDTVFFSATTSSELPSCG